MTLNMFLNISSPLFGLTGTILIFFYGLPPQIDENGHQRVVTQAIDMTEVAKARKYKFTSVIGLCLLAASFLLQLIATLIIK